MAPAAQLADAHEAPPPPSARVQGPPQLHRSHSSPTKRRTLGDWELLKTIGAGSMGKVKLARHRLTGEIAAVKIVPRYIPEGMLHAHNPKYLPLSTTHSATAPDNQSSAANSNSKAAIDESKEIRTVREAAIASLLDHRYICAVREVMAMTHHYYMVFEYVNGGQMLDYIISHGRLKEKQARKFARQIASAIDYCHHNSVVHRDLKIENILISKSGDIKIIDFGLSNLYSPKSLLKTFCGSLYFAAPELLNAHQYVGPEVDVWSFGIVLYVLACGKVPFDDQSMPALHAKIKRGHVEYPNWLSVECKSLLSRMLVVDPKQRATLAEIINHPWMLKGYDGPQDSYIPQRRPLTLPLDRDVIHGMHGFEFGSDERIERDLITILESSDYQAAVAMWNRQESASSSHSFANPFNGFGSLSPKTALFSDNASSNSHSKKKSTFSFEFYKRRQNSPSSSQETLSDTKPPDPTNAYHPLISIYYLAREKQERLRRRPMLESGSSLLSRSNSLTTSTTGGSSLLPTPTPPGRQPSDQVLPLPSEASTRPQPHQLSQLRPGRLEIPVVSMPETAHTHDTQPSSRGFFPRSRSIGHSHSGYTANRSSSPETGSSLISSQTPTANTHHQNGRALQPDLPPIPSGTMSGPESYDRQSYDRQHARRSSGIIVDPVIHAHAPQDSMMDSPVSANLHSPGSPSSGRRDGLSSLGTIFRRLSTRRSQRSNSTGAGAHAMRPPLSPSAGSAASSDDEVIPPLPTIQSFDVADGKDVPRQSPTLQPPQKVAVSFSQDTDTKSKPPMSAVSSSSSGNNPNNGNTPQSFIRFERLFSRASNIGRSTSISEGTYNRRVSRGI
ncbi:kinase-like domain-containing protein, partial [Limtongia smithiae]|uniref:kinase-like domain-containing protein n=1 Tax=Limtongia smithiae TaxID=1125753 RepID=UPI0034CDC450